MRLGEIPSKWAPRRSAVAAREIVDADHDLDAHQAEYVEAERGDGAGRARSDALALGRLAHPVTEIGTASFPVDAIERQVAEYAPLRVEHAKVIDIATLAAGLAFGDPCRTVIQAVTLVQPGQPGRDGSDRLARGLEQRLRVVRSPGPQAHALRVEFERGGQVCCVSHAESFVCVRPSRDNRFLCRRSRS